MFGFFRSCQSLFTMVFAQRSTHYTLPLLFDKQAKIHSQISNFDFRDRDPVQKDPNLWIIAKCAIVKYIYKGRPKEERYDHRTASLFLGGCFRARGRAKRWDRRGGKLGRHREPCDWVEADRQRNRRTQRCPKQKRRGKWRDARWNTCEWRYRWERLRTRGRCNNQADTRPGRRTWNHLTTWSSPRPWGHLTTAVWKLRQKWRI